MEPLIFNLKSYFKHQNKYFFEKAYALLEQYKEEKDEIYYDEKLHGEGYVLLKKEQKKYKIELYCTESHVWMIKLDFNANIQELEQNYNYEDLDILEIHKILINYI